jgi:hypothetical protein
LTTPIHKLFANVLCGIIVPAENSTWARTHVLRKSTIIHYCWNKICDEEENRNWHHVPPLSFMTFCYTYIYIYIYNPTSCRRYLLFLLILLTVKTRRNYLFPLVYLCNKLRSADNISNSTDICWHIPILLQLDNNDRHLHGNVHLFLDLSLSCWICVAVNNVLNRNYREKWNA